MMKFGFKFIELGHSINTQLGVGDTLEIPGSVSVCIRRTQPVQRNVVIIFASCTLSIPEKSSPLSAI